MEFLFVVQIRNCHFQTSSTSDLKIWIYDRKLIVSYLHVPGFWTGVMEEEAPFSAAAAIFAVLLLLHLFADFLSRIAPTTPLSPKERELLNEIRELHKAADSFSTPSTFAKAAKLKRQATVKEKEFAVLRQDQSRQRNWWLTLYSTTPNTLKIVVCIILALWFWRTSVATVPVSLLQPFEFLVSANKKSVGGELTVGIISWLVLTSRVSKFISTKVVGKPLPRKTAAKKLI
ncbi:hypothetical protein R1flu_007528 [Riccia fluitans]|uniref:Guided entry of tail-anchored proteins 1 n=1 Tax=Riccia fluitans TaxID=41844 RepID=A0ABD1YZ45_9MARC